MNAQPSTPAQFEERITNFDHLVRLFPRWDGSFKQLSCGRFESTFRVARGRQAFAHLASANQSLRVRGWDMPGACTFTLVLPASSGCTWQRRQLAPGSLVVRSGDIEVDHHTSKHATNLSFAVTEEGLRQAARTLLRADLETVGWLALSPPPEVFAALATRLQEFLGVGERSPAPVVAQEGRQREQACLAAAVQALYPAVGSYRVELPIACRTALVRRAEELMQTRLQISTGEIDLCSELGVSGRTLRLAFRERFGLGPMAYFQTLRLNAVRAVFRASDPEEISIAEVARVWGFGHPGKFAGYYRRQFGEKPSDTIRPLR